MPILTGSIIVDLSHWNNEDLPDMTKDKVIGVVHKATQGLTYNDPNYTARAKATRAAGFFWGAYHFGTGDDGSKQADHFLSIVQPDNQTFIALDLESNPDGSSMGFVQANAFVTRIKEVTGRWPRIYTGAWYTREILPEGELGNLGSCNLWIASYKQVPDMPSQWNSWEFQQFTDGVNGPEPTHLTGITADLDLNRYNGTDEQLRSAWGT